MQWTDAQREYLQTVYWRTEWKCRRGLLPFWVLFYIHRALVQFGLGQLVPPGTRDAPDRFSVFPEDQPAADSREEAVKARAYAAAIGTSPGPSEEPQVAPTHRLFLSEPEWSLGCTDVFPTDEGLFLRRYGPLLDRIRDGATSLVLPDENGLRTVVNEVSPFHRDSKELPVSHRAWRRLVARRLWETGVMHDVPDRIVEREPLASRDAGWTSRDPAERRPEEFVPLWRSRSGR